MKIPEHMLKTSKVAVLVTLGIIVVLLMAGWSNKTDTPLKKLPFENRTVKVSKKKASPESKITKERYRSFAKFRKALAFNESRGRYHVVNRFGYLGKYQFGAGTLSDLGIYNTKAFLKNPVLQEKAFILNVARNKWLLRGEIRYYVGKRIKGCRISESGLIAAAHLAGAGNVKKYLHSYGNNNVSDAFGTSLEDYLRRFFGYDISIIKQVRNPKSFHIN